MAERTDSFEVKLSLAISSNLIMSCFSKWSFFDSISKYIISYQYFSEPHREQGKIRIISKMSASKSPT